MSTIKKYLAVSLLCLGVLFTFSSCEKDLLKDMVEDKVYLLKEGLQTVDVYNFEKAILPIPVIKGGVGQRRAQVNLDVVPVILNEYNAANGTNYLLLPSEYYTVQERSLTLEAASYQEDFKIEMNSKKYLELLEQNPADVYVIPFQLTILNPIDGEKEKTDTFIIPHIVDPYAYFNEAGLLGNVYTLTASSPNSTSYYLKASINYPATNDIHLTLKVPSQAQAIIDQINTEQGTSYKLMPAPSYAIAENWVIKEGANYVEINMQVFRDKLADTNTAPLYGDYILPLEIASVSENKISPTNSQVFIPFKYHE